MKIRGLLSRLVLKPKPKCTGSNSSVRDNAGEQVLRRSEELLRLALRGAHAGAWVVDLDSNETYWNEELGHLYGFDPTERCSFERWTRSLHPDDRQRVLSELEARLSSGALDLEREFRIVHPTRGIRWILNKGSIERDASGTPHRIHGIDMDITDHKRTQEALRETERLCHAIIQQLPEGRVAVFDRERRYRFADGQLFSAHPTLASDKIVGKTMREVHPPERLPAIERLATDALAGGQAEVEVSLEGQVYRLVAAPLKYDAEGAVERCMLFTQDISAPKEIQRALEALSTTDGLLGIANRRAFEKQIDEQVRRAARERSPLALLMVDVDYFKIYNDRYGHQSGDACLQEVAQALTEAVARPGDLVARYGGEEFAVLLPDTDRAGALRVAERIHQLLAERAISFPASPVGRISVSIGVAADEPSPELMPSIMIAAADAGLYAAKHAGRNRTACANTEATETHKLG